MHINAAFRRKIAARNCGFRSIASVGAQIYGFVSSDAHAASGRKQLFAACLRCDRPVGGRNRKSSGLVKSSAQSESETGYSFTFAVLSKYRRRAVSTYALDGFRKNCLKSSPGRGLYFSARRSNNPYNIDIACANVYLTTIVIRQITYFILYPRALKYFYSKKVKSLEVVIIRDRRTVVAVVIREW